MATVENSHISEETAEVAALLRNDNDVIRNSRHFVSEAFAFLNDSLEAENEFECGDNDGEGDENVYSNVPNCTKKSSDHSDVAKVSVVVDEVLYSNVKQCLRKESSEKDRDPDYYNVASSLEELDVPEEDRLKLREACRGRIESVGGCKSKDSGFASLERHYLDETNLHQLVAVAVSDSDGDDDVEEEAGSGKEVLEDKVDDYVNSGAIIGAADASSETESARRHHSENVYDDLNLSLTNSSGGGTEHLQTPCLDVGEDNAIALAAENFTSAHCLDLEMGEKKGDNLQESATLCKITFHSQLKDVNSGGGDDSYTKCCSERDKDNKESVATEGSKESSDNVCDKVLHIDFSQVGSSRGSSKLSSDVEGATSSPGDTVVEDKPDDSGFTTEITSGESSTERKHRELIKLRFDHDDEDEEDEDVETSGGADGNVEPEASAVSDVDEAYDTISLPECDQGNSSGLASSSVAECGPGQSTRSETSESSVVPNSIPAESGGDELLDQVDGLDGSVKTRDHLDVKLQRRPHPERNMCAEVGSDDSSDEDVGIYAESFRRSNWIQVGKDGKFLPSTPEKLSSSPKGTPPCDITTASSSSSSSSSTSTSSLQHLSVGSLKVKCSQRSEDLEDIKETESISPKDDVFTDPLSEAVKAKQALMHKRSDSVSTTVSEGDFKRQYVTRRKCLIQRADSQQEYHRLSARVYDQDKTVVVQRSSKDDDLGLHLLDSHPAYITSVDPGSPADAAGIVEGQILVSVNDHMVLTTDHSDIVQLIQASEGNVRLGVANSDFQPVRDLQAAVMSGFMHKLGNNTFKTWKKRYFILRQDNCLYYYKSDQDKQDPLGALPLCGYTISRHTDTSKDFCFKAEKYGARTYFFMTDNRDQLTEWVSALTEAAARSKKRKESFLSVSSHNVGLPALDIRRSECSGYLGKLSPSHRSWRRRYCVLKDACIYYYKDVNSLRALGVAHLHGYKVDAENHSRRKHSFSLQPPEGKMRNFHFSADNETDKNRWVQSLILSIQRWVRVEREAEC